MKHIQSQVNDKMIKILGSMNFCIFNYVLFKIIGQPDNYKGENCATMRTHKSVVGELNDAGCVIGMQGYICQYSQGIYTSFK
jgi:hypothetical protein